MLASLGAISSNTYISPGIERYSPNKGDFTWTSHCDLTAVMQIAADYQKYPYVHWGISNQHDSFDAIAWFLLVVWRP